MSRPKKPEKPHKEPFDVLAEQWGRRGGKASMAARTPDELAEFHKAGAKARWKDHKYSSKPSAVSRRKKAAALKRGDS